MFDPSAMLRMAPSRTVVRSHMYGKTRGERVLCGVGDAARRRHEMILYW